MDQIDNRFPADQLLQFVQMHFFIFPKNCDERCIKEAMVVLADGSFNGRAAYVIKGKGYIQTVPSSDQIV